MKELKVLKKLLKKSFAEDEEELAACSEIYYAVANLKLPHDETKEFLEDVVPQLYIFCDLGLLKKDILYLSLLANNSTELVNLFLEYEKTILELNLSSSFTVFDFCYHRREHWFTEVIEGRVPSAQVEFSGELYNNIKILKLINITNEPLYHIRHVEELLSEIELEINDKFLKTYVKEIVQLVQTIRFINSIRGEAKNDAVYVDFLNRHSLLEVLSNYLDLRCDSHWEQIAQILSDRENYRLETYESKKRVDQKDYTELEHFIAFTAVHNLVKCLKMCKLHELLDKPKEVEQLLQSTQSRIVSLDNIDLVLEILENIFALLFMKDKHVTVCDKKGSKSDVASSDSVEFYCNEEPLVYFIISFLESVIDQLKSKNKFELQSAEYRRFSEISKCVVDAKWRLDIVIDEESERDGPKNVIHHMMGRPEALVNICMKQNSFSKAYQVFKIFNLQESTLAKEITKTETLLHIRYKLKRTFCAEDHVDEIIRKEFSNEENERIIRENSDKNKRILHYQASTETFRNLFDVALTLPMTFETAQPLIDALHKNYNLTEEFQSYLSKFYKRINGISQYVSVSMPDILIDPIYSLDAEYYRDETECYNRIARCFAQLMKALLADHPGTLNPNHASHKLFLRLQDACSDYSRWRYGYDDNKVYTKYFTRVLNYLKMYSKIFYLEGNHMFYLTDGRDTSYLNIINKTNKSKLIGKLIYEKHLEPFDFQKLYQKVKLDLTYDVAGNSFPHVALSTGPDSEQKKEFRRMLKPNKVVLTFINTRHWLLAYILNEMYKVQDPLIQPSDSRVNIFHNFVNTPAVKALKVIYNDNEITTALYQDNHAQKIIEFCDSEIEKSVFRHNAETSIEEIEHAEEMDESIRVTDWYYYLKVVDTISEVQLRRHPQLAVVKDSILYNIVIEKITSDHYKYVRFIRDNALRTNTILREMKYWPAWFCLDVIKDELSSYALENAHKELLNEWFPLIKLHDKLASVLPENNWFEIHLQCLGNSNKVIKGIMGTTKIDIMLDYIKLYEPTIHVLLAIDLRYLENLFLANVALDQVELLLSKLPPDHVTKLLHLLMRVVKKLDQLKFLSRYLLETNLEETEELKHLEVSLKILSCLHTAEQDQLYGLIFEPLGMLEVLVMNTRLDKLGEVINTLIPCFERKEFEEKIISMEKIDALLRTYAEKSLDFRVITQPNPRLLKSVETRLLQSLESLSTTVTFVMPDEVPTKEQWIPNYEVIECMCCRKTAFSMFNRRHHCRRCGRVVCFSCSTKRLPIETYGSVLVRVCTDCYELLQTDGNTSIISDASTKSFNYDFWCLSDDKAENAIIREEFSYEHAPSVSLCLAILKHHSKTHSCPIFLLNQCEKMLKLLKPRYLEAVHEIDYQLVIRMLKSLAIAAKIEALECDFFPAIHMAEDVLKQADLYMLLAEKGRLNLLSQWKSEVIDASILRRLRDKLLEDEQWTFALEVSLKVGLDNSGVFATWGKSCLRAGHFQLAREKFKFCFDRLPSSDPMMPSSSSGRVRTISMTADGKPLRDPPLLEDIIYILESLTTTVLSEALVDEFKMAKLSLSPTGSINKTLTKNDMAICIQNKLKNLNAIADGKYFRSAATEPKGELQCDPRIIQPFMESIFYHECIYYLGNYGSHLSLVQFYLKHGEYDIGLRYLVENKLNADVFVEIYMGCLKQGIINILQEYMLKIDPPLDVWKDYLKLLCKHLQMKNCLHSLYQVQQFMNDYIRASMSCLRFYTENATSFAELITRNKFLTQAETHLRQALEREQWIEVAPTETTSGSTQEYEMKALGNPELIMRMSTKQIERCIISLARQKEAVEFLVKFEEKRPMMEIIADIVTYQETNDDSKKKNPEGVPTLFDTLLEKIQVAVLCIVCGITIKDGFHIGRCIIEDYKLRAVKVYCQAGKILVKQERFNAVAQLVQHIKSMGPADSSIRDTCDEMLVTACRTCKTMEADTKEFDNLAKLIQDPGVLVNTYIEAGYLKTAYTIALRYNRTVDIRRIMAEAELTNRRDIKQLCQKTLETSGFAAKNSPNKQTPQKKK